MAESTVTIISALRKTAEGLSALAEALESGQFGVPDPPNLKSSDVAQLLACGSDTVRSLVHRENDALPCVKVGDLLRFRRSAVLEWAARQTPAHVKRKVKKQSSRRPPPVVGLVPAVRRGQCD